MLLAVRSLLEENLPKPWSVVIEYSDILASILGFNFMVDSMVVHIPDQKYLQVKVGPRILGDNKYTRILAFALGVLFHTASPDQSGLGKFCVLVLVDAFDMASHPPGKEDSFATMVVALTRRPWWRFNSIFWNEKCPENWNENL